MATSANGTNKLTRRERERVIARALESEHPDVSDINHYRLTFPDLFRDDLFPKTYWKSICADRRQLRALDDDSLLRVDKDRMLKRDWLKAQMVLAEQSNSRELLNNRQREVSKHPRRRTDDILTRKVREIIEARLPRNQEREKIRALEILSHVSLKDRVYRIKRRDNFASNRLSAKQG